jgi:hypothetical protein
MAPVSAPTKEPANFGATARQDAWWVGPMLTVVGLTAFLVYGTWAAWQGSYFEIRQSSLKGGDFYSPDNPAVAPYLAPFYAPLIYDPSPDSSQSHHAWFHGDLKPSWWPSVLPFTSAFLILIFPGLFRFTCYYYRKAYYRSFWADPPACAVGEPRKSYWGENRWPLLIQNSHRYWMYFAVLFLILLTWDAIQAFWWPIIEKGNVTGHRFGVGLGTLIMVINIVLLAFFTFGCNSVRHLVGGRLNHFSCFNCPKAGVPPERLRTSYRIWHWSTILNENHMLWAWLSLFSVGFTDLYIRMCAMGLWRDWKII